MDSNTTHYIAVPQDEYNRIWNSTPPEERAMEEESDLSMANWKCFKSRRYNAVILASLWHETPMSLIIKSLIDAKSKAFISFRETVDVD